MSEECGVSRDTHVVGSGETLRSIAALYDLTPSQLATANNRIGAITLFPGQTIKIPSTSVTTSATTTSATSSATTSSATSATTTSATTSSAPTGSAAPTSSAPTRLTHVSMDPEIVESEFVKLNVKLITRREGTIWGSLLFTPKTVMFIPNANDPIVVEMAEDEMPDRFQIVAPTELLVNLAIFSEFDHQKDWGVVDDDQRLSEAIFQPEQKIRDEQTIRDEEDDQTIRDEEDVEKESESVTSSASLYLRWTMGKPHGRRLSRSAPILSFGHQTLLPCYWFIISSLNAERLHSFVQSQDAFRDKYGLLRHMEVERVGYDVIRDDEPLLEEDPGKTCNRESVSRMIRRTITLTQLPEIEMKGGDSELIDGEYTRNLIVAELPPRVDGHAWVKAYSTTRDGFSLNAFYRKMTKFPESPILLLIAETGSESLFGCYLSSPPCLSEHFLGTGECFVFSLKEEFVAYHWTGENEYFFRGDMTNFEVGSGDGRAAIWLDADLNQGRSQPCATFDNACLSRNEDFHVRCVECWAFEL